VASRKIIQGALHNGGGFLHRHSSLPFENSNGSDFIEMRGELAIPRDPLDLHV